MDRDTIIENLRAAIETCDVDIAATQAERDRFAAALDLLAAPGEVVAVVAATAPAVQPKRSLAPIPADAPRPPKPRKPRTYATSTGTGTKRESKYDYAEVARVALAAHERGKPMGHAVALGFDVADAMGSWLVQEARRRGHVIPKRPSSAELTAGHGAAITPAEIRHEVEPIPAAMRVTEQVTVEPIRPSGGSFGFADRPTSVEHVVETERHGWRPGMGAEVLAGSRLMFDDEPTAEAAPPIDIAAWLARPEWMADAACRGSSTAVFYPPQGGDSATPKAICRGCPVQADCLDYAMINGDRFGIWGGLSEKERRALRRTVAGRDGISGSIPGSNRKPIDHGTANGAAAHRRRGEQPCRSCMEAAAASAAEYKQRARAL